MSQAPAVKSQTWGPISGGQSREPSCRSAPRLRKSALPSRSAFTGPPRSLARFSPPTMPAMARALPLYSRHNLGNEAVDLTHLLGRTAAAITHDDPVEAQIAQRFEIVGDLGNGARARLTRAQGTGPGLTN